MALRGPGSIAHVRAREAVAKKPRKRFAWDKKGLTRPERVIAFLESLPITSGTLAGQRMKLLPFQRDFIHAVYGPKTADGRRQVRTALLSCGRKNGKSGLAAGLCLAHLLGPETEARGQVFSAAADREQAALIYRECAAIIDATPWMLARCNIQRFHKQIEDLETGTLYKALSADARTKHGLSASLVLYDELAQAPNRDLYDTLATSTGARAEPLLLTISTQSSDAHHVMSELVDYAKQVNDGVIEDPSFVGHVYAVPMEADAWDEANWYLANPALNVFRSLEEMRISATRAQRIPAQEAVFRSLYLNQRVDAAQRFLASVDWDACGGTFDVEALRGRPCFGGLDLSSTTDLTALVLFFPEDAGAVLAWFWVPDANIGEREDRDRVPYRVWKRDGFIETTPGKAIDKNAIARRLAEIVSTYDVRGIGYDRWGFKELERALNEEGVDAPLKAMGQGFRDQTPCVAALEAAVLRRELQHAGNPVLRWCISNCVVTLDAAGGRKLDKSKAVDRIDGAVALGMALGLHAQRDGEAKFGGLFIDLAA